MSRGTSLWEEIWGQAERRPEAPALVWHGEHTSYRELRRAAERARRLVEGLSLEDGEAVGILAKKSPAAVALVLGCLAAERGFLLPSPHLAHSQLRSLFTRAGCRYVLHPEGPGGIAYGAPAPDRSDGAPAHGRKAPPGATFMLTTSGSTGLPKIVPLQGRAIARFMGWAADQFDIDAGTSVLNYAPLNFDLCLLDIWTTLARGGQVVLVDPDRATDGGHLLDLLSTNRVDVVQAVPMFFQLLSDAAHNSQTKLDSVRHVMFTGDAIAPDCLARLPHLFTNARFYNLYGCTETNDSLIHEVHAADILSGGTSPLPLGAPLPGVRALIVSDEGTVLDGAGMGELYISTPFQTTGYIDGPGDRGRFVTKPDPSGEVRYFRTGDLVRRTAGGDIQLVGRSDHQIKVRGVRLNTTEVERALAEHDQVIEAAVVAVPDPLAGHRLHGVVRRRGSERLTSLVLKQHCAERLDRVAIPSVFHVVDDPLPKTSTGKLDRPSVQRRHVSPTEFENQPTEGENRATRTGDKAVHR